jgi:hypothetical protein
VLGGHVRELDDFGRGPSHLRHFSVWSGINEVSVESVTLKSNFTCHVLS